MLPVNVTLQRDGKTENLTLLTWALTSPSRFPWARKSSLPACDLPTPGGRFRELGLTIVPETFCLGSGWRGGSRRNLAMRVTLSGRPLQVSGVLSTGGGEDDQIVAPLALAQEILGKPGAVRRVYVSALTKPEDALARRDPKSMSGSVYDRWYCSPYPQSIAFQLQEAIPHSHAEQIRQVAQNEGAVLTRIEGLIFLIRWRRCLLQPWLFRPPWRLPSLSAVRKWV